MAEPNPLGEITAMAIDPSDSKTFLCDLQEIGKKRPPPSLSPVMKARNWKREGTYRDWLTRLWVNPHSPAAARMLLIAGAHFIGKKPPPASRACPVLPQRRSQTFPRDSGRTASRSYT